MTGGQPTRGFSVEAENSLNNIHYRIVPPSRYEDVIRLLYGSFFTDEPMSKCLGLTDGIRRDPILDEFVYAGLEENLSIMAIDASTGKLLGACINVAAVKNEVEETLEDSLQKYKDSSFRQIVHVLYNVNRDGGDIFGEMDSNILFDIKMIAADKHNRKGGLATDLLRRSVDLAKCLGFKGIKTEATGLYSRKAFQRIGFEVKAECIYEDFVTLDGEKIFIDAKEPHRCTTLMTKKI